jgi:hypothetical protein
MKRQFDLLRRRPLMDYSFPRFAGGAIWALHFQHRLTKPMALLVNATPYLLENHYGPDIGTQYNLLVAGIEQVKFSNQCLEIDYLTPKAPFQPKMDFLTLGPTTCYDFLKLLLRVGN